MVFEMGEDTLRTLALMNETGYSIHQDNGQRIYGPPPDWHGPAPKDTEVFIGKLPNDIFEYDIVPLFSSVGKIYLLRIMQNFSGLNRGFAFVQYTTPEDADKAIRLLNNAEIRPGEKIGVVKSRNNCRLYIGRLDTTMTKEEIRYELEKFTEDIIEVIIHKSEVSGQNNRGYAFVEYLTHKAAAKARRKLVPCKIKIRGVEVTVDWATPLHECGEILNVFNSLLIKNIRETARNDELCQFYSLHNKLKILKFKRLPNKLVITFSSRDEAEKAMQIYEDLKNTKEFVYFAEKNKRVEIVWLKNNMNLSSFSSSINYTPPKFYDSIREECFNSTHQHNTYQTNDKAKLMNNRSQSQPFNNLNNKQFSPSANINNNKSLMYKLNNSLYKIKAANQRSILNGHNSQNSKLHANASNQIPMVNRLNSMTSRGLGDGYECSSNTLASRLNNYLGNTLGNSSPLANLSNNLAFRATPSPVISNPSNGPPGFNNAWTKNSGNLTSLNGNFDNANAFRQLNASNNLSISKNLDKNSILSSLNTSYNFGIWTNVGGNLDVSANWSKFKDCKMKKSQLSSLSSNDTNNISEEDVCSLKSDSEYGGASMTNFNRFDSTNNLNLHENFRTLSVNKNLPKYSLFNPILQQ